MKRLLKSLTIFIFALTVIFFNLSFLSHNIIAKNSVSIMFTGDFLFSKDYPPYLAYLKRGRDISKCIDKAIIDKMKAVDIMVMNNEFTYTNRGKPTPGKKFTFRANPKMAENLNKMGVDLVSLANNHSYDYGEISLLDSIAALKKVKIPYVGAGKNIKEARRPVYFEKNGIKIAIVAATSIERHGNPPTKPATKNSAGVARCLDTKNFEKVIKKAKKNADIVIAFVHWGTEGTNYIDALQKKQAKNMARAGVDVIVGAHPHVLQKIDYVDNVPVVYSLGNFWFNSRTLDTGMFKVTVDKNGVKKCKFIPCIQKSLKTTLLKGKDKKRVLKFMQKLSPNVKFDKDGYFVKK